MQSIGTLRALLPTVALAGATVTTRSPGSLAALPHAQQSVAMAEARVTPHSPTQPEHQDGTGHCHQQPRSTGWALPQPLLCAGPSETPFWRQPLRCDPAGNTGVHVYTRMPENSPSSAGLQLPAHGQVSRAGALRPTTSAQQTYVCGCTQKPL